jgi:hypothetical protein
MGVLRSRATRLSKVAAAPVAHERHARSLFGAGPQQRLLGCGSRGDERETEASGSLDFRTARRRESFSGRCLGPGSCARLRA